MWPNHWSESQDRAVVVERFRHRASDLADIPPLLYVILIDVMPNLTEFFPDAKTLLDMEPEELGDVIVEIVQKGGASSPERFGKHDILHVINHRDTREWPFALRGQLTQAVYEAFAWLQQAGFIINDPTQTHSMDWYILSRRGKKLTDRKQAAAYREAALLPVHLLHPEIHAKSHAAFLRGDYDIAVFASFMILEVAVRKAGSYPDGELGTKLMRKAFEPAKGPLTDKTLEAGEQQAQSDLFAGAIGAAKNPTSHRQVEMTKTEAARLLVFASYLMSVLEESAGRSN